MTWTYRKEEGWETAVIDNENGTTICEVYKHQEEKAQKMVFAANTQPDLLAACQELLLYAEGGPKDREAWKAWAISNVFGMTDRARAAIAKATQEA
jgi:hypothetical protein